VISAYKNVVINHFTLIGDPDYDLKGNPVVAVQYRARNVVLNHVSFKNFKGASAGIKVFGGDHRADSVEIQNVRADNCFRNAIEVWPGIDYYHHLQ
jgi:hypothetical protein